MLNILLNAIQAVPKEGKITATTDISSRGDDAVRYLKISVSDTGKGIDAEHQKRIFEPFYSSKIGGTGLGLPICKKIKFDLIFSGKASFPLQLGFVLSRILNKKLVVAAHGNDFVIKSAYLPTTYFLKNCDGIIIGTNSIRNIFQRIHKIKRNKIKVIPDNKI